MSLRISYLKKYASIFFVIVLIALSGCKTGINMGKQPIAVNYHTGTEGLVMSFVRDNPPDEIMKGSDFSMLLEVKNKGVYPISGGTVTLEGIGLSDPKYFSMDQKFGSLDLDGKGVEFPDGGYDVLYFKVKSLDTPENSIKYPVTATATAIYEYKTEANAEVCINPNQYGIKQEGCEVKAVILSGGQGAPVAVTKIEEAIGYAGPENEFNIITLIFYVANVGSGKLADDKLIVDGVMLGDKKMNCLVNNPFQLKKGEEKSFTCQTIIEKPRGAYLSPVIAKMSYGYIQTLYKQFDIKSLTTG